VIRNLIDDAWIAFEDKVMPVASFKVNYKLDTLPKAVIVPALGRSLTGGRRVPLSEVKENERADLFLKINGVTKLLFSGFVSHISGSDNSEDTTGQRALSSMIILNHRAIKLAGSPPVSFAYSGNKKDMFTVLNDHLARVQLFGTDAQAQLSPLSGFLSMYVRDLGVQIASPTVTFKYIIQKLMSEFSPLMDVDDIVQAYEPAVMLADRPNPGFINLIKDYANAFSRGWTNSNSWESLLRACSQFFLHVVPYNNGIYIADPLALFQVPSKVITSKEYTNIQQSSARGKVEPVDGVVVRVPAKVEPSANSLLSPIVYPPVTQAPVMPTKRYYHFASVPPWLHPILSASFGTRNSKPVNKTNRSSVEEGKELEVENVPEHYQNVGERLAKMLYSMVKMDKTAMSLLMPFRDDLMPGTNVQIENTDSEDLSFIGDTLYGMIYSTSIECSTLQPPGRIQTTIQVVSVRNTQDNEALGLDEHPIYSHPWVGIDLFGNFLEDPPAVNLPNIQRQQEAEVVRPDATVVNPTDPDVLIFQADRALGGRDFAQFDPDLDEVEVERAGTPEIGGNTLIPINIPGIGF
jgi:hypothetical protein